MPKVSIIMPVYNKEKYVVNSIGSVLQQKFDDFELIIVDDGSTDRTSEILDIYATLDSRISVHHIKNGGVSNARNIGLRHATGQWIQFLDGDDFIDPLYLSKALPIVENQNVDILFSEFDKVSLEGEVLERINIPETGWKQGDTLPDDFMQHQFNSGYYGYISNKLFSRRLLMRTKAQFPIGIKLAEDLDFYVHLYQGVTSCFYSTLTSFRYLQTDQNYQFDTNIDYLDQILIMLDIKSWLKISERYINYQNFIDGRICNYACYAAFDAIERNFDIYQICEQILAYEEIMDCLKIKYTSGLNRIITILLQHRQITAVKHVLNMRKAIRNIYRAYKNERICIL